MGYVYLDYPMASGGKHMGNLFDSHSSLWNAVHLIYQKLWRAFLSSSLLQPCIPWMVRGQRNKESEWVQDSSLKDVPIHFL
jgi:hypothetical protein